MDSSDNCIGDVGDVRIARQHLALERSEGAGGGHQVLSDAVMVQQKEQL
jgi:hypothetical protein